MSSQQPGVATRLSSLVLISLMGMGGWTVYNRTLETQRPQVAVERMNAPTGLELVPARLWQDPFQAVAVAKTNKLIDESEYELDLKGKLPNQALHIIVVPMPGGDYPEDTELRLRTRYAIVSALGASDFVPENIDHIGVAKANVKDKASASNVLLGWLPFEIFRPAPGTDKAETQLILWVEESRILDDITGFSLLLGYLDRLGGNREEATRYSMIGPTSSDRLVDLAVYFSSPELPLPNNPQQSGNDNAATTVATPSIAAASLNRNEEASTTQSARSIAHICNQYLDRPLNDTDEEVLVQYLSDWLVANPEASAHEQVVEALAKAIQNWPKEIPDTDPAWKSTVAAIWRAIQFDDVESASRRASRTLWFLHQYLDGYTWVQKLACGEMVCADDTKLYEALKQCFEANTSSEPIRNCVKGVLSQFGENIQDSNPEWADAVARFAERDWGGANARRPTDAGAQPGAKAIAAESALTGAPTPPITPDATLSESRDSAANARANIRDRLRIYSHRATMPARYVMRQVNPGQSELACEQAAESALSGLFHSPAATLSNSGTPESALVRCVATDDKVAEAILKELGKRGLNDDKDKPFDVAIITEWDTTYGRRMPEIFRKQFDPLFEALPENRPGGDGEHVHPGSEDATSPHFHVFHYLRGLDGTTPRERRTTEHNENSGKSANTNDPRATYQWVMTSGSAKELPFGADQRDYVRRLGMELEARDRAARAQGSSGIRAIGVLGSDVFDKELILQALRGQFPQAVFFTTDLEAHLAHPSQYHWSRNLVIASAFGLKLHPDLQGTIPPFRDSYQTAAFLAMRMALADETIGSSAPEASGLRTRAAIHAALQKSEPLVFEVSRYGPWDLCDHAHDPIHAAPVGPRPWGWPKVLSGGAAVLLGLFIVLERLRRSLHADGQSRGLDRYGGLVALLVAIGLVAALAYHLIGIAETQEPLVWAGGISVIPSIVVRFVTAALAVLLFWHAWTLDENRQRGLWNRIGKKLPANRFCRHPEWWRGLLLADVTLPKREAAFGKPRMEWKDFLAVHRRSIRGWTRVGRVLLASAVLVLALSALDVWNWNWQPFIRGAEAHWLERFSYNFGLVLLVLLSGFVVELCVVSRESIRSIAHLRFPGDAQQGQADADSYSAKCAEELQRVETTGTISLTAAEVLTYPIYALALLMFARLSIFDGWAWSSRELGAIAIFVVWPLTCGLLLRRTAEELRARIIDRMEDWQLDALTAGKRQDADLVRETIEQVRAYQYGALGSITQQPVVRALIAPFGGFGLIALLDVLYVVGL